MKARIVNYRQGRHRQTTNQMILKVDGVSSKDAAGKLLGKSVSWKSPAGKELKGKVSSIHGNSGCVRVLFETGMPGQALGTAVIIN